jgi:hypothetical protein
LSYHAVAVRLRQQQVQRIQYEADQERLRYMRVDPNNRLVADTLEAQWNEKLRLPLPRSVWALRKTKAEIVAEIDRLLDQHTEAEIAQLLIERGWHSSSGAPFSFRIVDHLRRAYRLKSRRQRLQVQYETNSLNQFNKRGSWARSIRATCLRATHRQAFFIGSRRLRRALAHQ